MHIICTIHASQDEGEYMKICVPSMDDKGLQAPVSGHFGSATTFTIFDTETQEVEVLVNQNDHQHHGGCTPVGLLAEKKINAIICQGMGKNAITRLSQGGIDVYVTQANQVQMALDEFQKGSLEKISLDHACPGH